MHVSEGSSNAVEVKGSEVTYETEGNNNYAESTVCSDALSSNVNSHVQGGGLGHSYVRSDIGYSIREAEKLIVSSKRQVNVMFENMSLMLRVEKNVVFRGIFESILCRFDPRKLKTLLHKKLKRPNKKDSIHKKNDRDEGNYENISLMNINGLVKEGEMCLVIDSSGIWANALFETLSLDFRNVVRMYGALEIKGLDMNSEYNKISGLVSYNRANDNHIEDLSVSETLAVALKFRSADHTLFDNNTKKRKDRKKIIDLYLQTLSLKKRIDNLVGYDEKNGLSYDERKELSVAELLSVRYPIVCWEKITRGLDINNALTVIRALRTSCDALNTTFFVSLDVANDQIYHKFDKVMVIDNGHMIYFGPTSGATEYFESLGYRRVQGEEKIDFIMSVSSHNCDDVKAHSDHVGPDFSSEELCQAFANSIAFRNLKEEISAHKYKNILSSTSRNCAVINCDNESILSKPPSKGFKPKYSVKMFYQIWNLFSRDLICGWKSKFRNTHGSLIFFIVSSILVGIISPDIHGSFPSVRCAKSFIFTSLVLSLAYVIYVFNNNRNLPIIEKYNRYGFCSPVSVFVSTFMYDLFALFLGLLLYVIISTILTDDSPNGIIRMIGFQLVLFINSLLIYSIFNLVYFLCKSSTHITNIFISFYSIYLCLCTTYHVELDPNSNFLTKFLLNTNPLHVAYEIILYRMFNQGVNITCGEQFTIPNGLGYSTVESRSCITQNLARAAGYQVLNGLNKIEISLVFDFSLLVMFLIILIVFGVTCKLVKPPVYLSNTACRFISSGKKKKPVLLGFPLEHNAHIVSNNSDNINENPTTNIQDITNDFKKEISASNSAEHDIKYIDEGLVWKNLTFNITTPNGQKKLFNNFSGYALPGRLIGIFGESKAGKTLFLNLISIGFGAAGATSGSLHLGGNEFNTVSDYLYVYNDHSDHLKETLTVREAIRHSAYICAGGKTSEKKIDAHTEWIIGMLNLTDYADAIIGEKESKYRLPTRVTKLISLAVDIASSTGKIFIFDDPITRMNYLEGQNFIKLLKKFTRFGYIVMCAIHRPTAKTFELFDDAILLAPIGRVIYNGPIGKDHSIIKEYFGNNGMEFDLGVNFTDYVMNSLSSIKQSMEWEYKWRKSPQNDKIKKDIEFLGKRMSNIPELEANKLSVTNTSDKACDATLPIVPESYRVSDSRHTYSQKMPIIKEDIGCFKKIKIYILREMISINRHIGYVKTRMFIIFIITLINIIGQTLFHENVKNLDKIHTFVVYETTFTSMLNSNVIIAMIVPIVLAVAVRYYKESKYYEYENNFNICNTYINTISFFVSELPMAIFGSILYFLAITVFKLKNFTFNALIGNISALFAIQIYAISLGIIIPAIAKSKIISINILIAILTLLILTSGTIYDYILMNSYFKDYFFLFNPIAWFSSFTLLQNDPNLQSKPLPCDTSTSLIIRTPPKYDCMQYMKSYISINGGYLLNPENIDFCYYCYDPDVGSISSVRGVKLKEYSYAHILIIISFFALNSVIFLLVSGSKYSRFKFENLRRRIPFIRKYAT